MACGSDNRHTLFVMEWRSKQIVCEMTGHTGAPPQVYGVLWNPFVKDQIISYGINHIKTWDRTNTGSYMHTAGIFGKVRKENISEIVRFAYVGIML